MENGHLMTPLIRSVGPVFLFKNNYTINNFFQTQTHCPWLIFCEERISEQIFNDHTLYTPLHMYNYIQDVIGLIGEWKCPVYLYSVLLLSESAISMCMCAYVCMRVRERESVRG